MEKVLITGGAGDIGYYLALREQAAGNWVYIVDNFSRGRRDEAFKELLRLPAVELLQGDLLDRDFVATLPTDVEIVYHLAALNGTSNFYECPFTVLEQCTVPTILLLEKYGQLPRLKRFVYAGSSEAYASSVSKFGWPVPTDESVPLAIDDPLNPRWSYGASKLHGEIACVAASHQLGVPVTVVRFHNVYGQRMNSRHVIPDFIARAKQGIFRLHGAENTRSFLYATDAAEACALAARAAALVNEIVNIGSEDEISMLELARKIMRAMNLPDTDIEIMEAPEGSVMRRAPKIAKLRAATGFSPAVSLEKGLKLVLSGK